jgi:hypothetical protein
MAKSSRVKAAARRAAPGRKSGLLTSSERKLLAASESAGLAGLTVAERQALLVQTRALRDKWRDLLTGQHRVQKRKATAADGANARTREKADLFDAAIRRIEAHSAAAPAGQAAAAKPAAAGKKTKKSRTAGHRQARADMKAELAAHTRHLAAARKPAAAVPARAKPAAAPKAAAKAPAPATRGAVPPVTTRVATVESKRLARKQAAKQAGQQARFDRTSQRAAQAAAKKARLSVSGRTTRLGGHLLASGKRAQARRDRKGR